MAEIPSLGPPLAGDVLARRRTLPTKPDDVELAGHTVTLRRYSPTDVLELHEMSDGSPVTRLGRALGAYDADELVWRFLAAGSFANGNALARYHDYLASLPDSRVFSVVDRSWGDLLGS